MFFNVFIFATLFKISQLIYLLVYNTDSWDQSKANDTTTICPQGGTLMPFVFCSRHDDCSAAADVGQWTFANCTVVM